MLDIFDLTGHVALVTGGNGGIGLGMAVGLAQAGADIMIWGTNEQKNASAATRLAQYGTRIESRLVDVSSEREVVDAMQEAARTMGRIDSVFANAGIGNEWKSFLDIGGDAYRRLMSVNVDGVLWTVREACRHMKSRAERGDPGGSIVIVSSMVSRFGAARSEDYALSKSAVNGITRSVAVEFARHGIRCNSVLPGWVATDISQALQDSDAFTEKVISRVPQRRWGRPDEFAGIAVYLASKASSFHTGDEILIDGGYTVF